jgi:predicted Ser/Thr protein kinase
VGVYHADLNLRNLLVRLDSHELEVFIIDFDKARIFERPVPSSYRRRNLERLSRSVRKLDPSRRYVSDEDWSAFLAAYHG